MSTIKIRAAQETTAEFPPELAAGLAIVVLIVVLTILGLAGVSPTIAAVLCCVDLFPRRATKVLEFRPAFFPGAFAG